MGDDGDEQVGRLFAPELFEEAHKRAMKQANGRLQQAQKVDAAESPAILQQHVVLLLNANAGELAQDVELVGEFLELDELDLPGALLLGGDGLQSNGGVAVATAAVMENNVYFLHGRHCDIRFRFAAKSTLDAMWITLEVSCVQPVPWTHLPRICALFTDCSYHLAQNKSMRCDLHVHSVASGMFDAPVLSRICRESYNDATEVYERLKHLGMSIVTITDHDSIDAMEELRRYPDFFLSEEVTVKMPSGTLMHLGVYGISERDHAEIQRRRSDFFALSTYLTERKLFSSVNHVFSGLTGSRDEEDFRCFAACVPAFEVRNGQMWMQANASAEKLAKRLGKVGIAGSDSHTIAGVGRTYTEVAGARTAEEFLAGLRAGRGVACGAHGSYAKLTADVYRIVLALLLDQPWTLPLMPVAAFVPAFTAAHWLNEIRFCRKWSAKLESEEKRLRLLCQLGSGLETNLAG